MVRAERMVHSARTIPHYAYVDECDATDLVRLRDSLRETFAERGVHLTFLPFIVRAAESLKEFPIVNASADEEQEELILHDRYDVGIATATPRGLVVPVVRNADRLSLAQIGREIERLSGEARTGQLRPDDLGRSTFSITLIGGIGGLIATPVINHPEVAILCIGRVVKRPVYDAAGAGQSRRRTSDGTAAPDLAHEFGEPTCPGISKAGQNFLRRALAAFKGAMDRADVTNAGRFAGKENRVLQRPGQLLLKFKTIDRKVSVSAT